MKNTHIKNPIVKETWKMSMLSFIRKGFLIIFAIWEPDFTTLHRPHHDLWPARQGVFCHSQTWQWQNPSETKNLTCCLVIHIKYHQTYIFSNMATAAGRQERYIFIYIYIFATTHRHDDMIFSKSNFYQLWKLSTYALRAKRNRSFNLQTAGFHHGHCKVPSFVAWVSDFWNVSTCDLSWMCHESDVHTLIFTWKLNSWIAFGGSVAFPPKWSWILSRFLCPPGGQKNRVGISKRR